MESQPPCKKQNVAPVPSGKDLFCIPQWRWLPWPRLSFLTQPLLQGTGMGVRESPSGRVEGNALAGHAEGGDPKKGSFPASPTTPISFHWAGPRGRNAYHTPGKLGACMS